MNNVERILTLNSEIDTVRLVQRVKSLQPDLRQKLTAFGVSSHLNDINLI